jgi:hypothetical protein
MEGFLLKREEGKMKRTIVLNVIFVLLTFSLAYATTIELTPYVDGQYYYDYNCYHDFYDCASPVYCEEHVGLMDSNGFAVWTAFTCVNGFESHNYRNMPIIEFNISSLKGLFKTDQFTATLRLNVSDSNGTLGVIFLQDIHDGYENGVMELEDAATDYNISSIEGSYQGGDTLSFDVTNAIQHDLFDAYQTNFSGFNLLALDNPVFYVSFWSLENESYSPKLIIETTQIPQDTDTDGIPDNTDNCPSTCNPLQQDADNDGIGDLCDNDPGCGGCSQPQCEQACPSPTTTSTTTTTPDTDSDGILDNVDNCPAICNSQQLDADGDGIGDVCDDPNNDGCGGCGQPECEQRCS